jgi:hypothetical protein
MRALVTFTDRREVEISDRQAADIAEQVIRRRYDLGDATAIGEGGHLITWSRDDRGDPVKHAGRCASAEERAALHVAMSLRHL